MMANQSNYLRDKLGRLVMLGESYTPPSDLYLALCEVAPDATDIGTEVDGGSYARVAVTFDATATDGVFEINTASIPDMPEVDVEGLAILDDETGGNMLFFEDFSSSPVSVQSGDTYVIPEDSIDVSFL